MQTRRVDSDIDRRIQNFRHGGIGLLQSRDTGQYEAAHVDAALHFVHRDRRTRIDKKRIIAAQTERTSVHPHCLVLSGDMYLLGDIAPSRFVSQTRIDMRVDTDITHLLFAVTHDRFVVRKMHDLRAVVEVNTAVSHIGKQHRIMHTNLLMCAAIRGYAIRVSRDRLPPWSKAAR